MTAVLPVMTHPGLRAFGRLLRRWTIGVHGASHILMDGHAQCAIFAVGLDVLPWGRGHGHSIGTSP